MTEPRQIPGRSAPYRGALGAAIIGGTWAALFAFGVAHDLLHHLLFALAAAATVVAVRSTRRASEYSRSTTDVNEVRDQLKTAELRYRSLVESIPAVIYIDAPGAPWTTLYMSPQVEDLIGFTPEEMTGPSSLWERQIHPDDREKVLDEAARHMATGEKLDSSYRMIARTGEVVWVSRRAEVVRDDEGHAIFSQGVVYEVTELKDLEERLALLQSAVVNTSDSVMIAEAQPMEFPHGPKIVYVNEAFQRLTGYSSEEAVGKKVGILRGPRTSVEDIEKLNETLRKGEAGRAELLNYRKDGSEHWVEVSVNPVFDSAGECTHYVSVSRDVTERRNENGRIRALMMNSVDTIWVIGPSGEVIYNSPSITKVLGYSQAELNDFSGLDLFHPDDVERAAAYIAGVISGDAPLQSEWRLAHKDGSWRYIETIATNLLDDPHIQGIVLNGHDVTERKRAEEVLREAEERFRSAFENAPYGMTLVSLEGNYLKVNKTFEMITGYTEDQLRSLTWQSITHSEDLEDDLEFVHKMLMGEIRTYQMRKRYIHADGREMPVAISVSLMRDRDGAPLYFISQVEDVTERNKLEEQLRQSQKLEAVGQLAGGIAHDFNNLLSVIQSYARFVMETLHEGDPAYEDAHEIVKAGDRAAALVRQLLAFSRKEITNPQILNLNDAIAEIERMLRRTIGEDVQLVTDLRGNLAGIRLDPGNLEQVIMNMTLNARDAMPNGGTITIRTDNVHVPPGGAVTPGEYVSLTVTDTGRGINPDIADRIFEPFFTTKSRGRGTGLGLATVYGVVEQAGGKISVQSVPEGGTTFDVLFPATSLESRKDQGQLLTTPMPGESETILVAEDEESVRKLVQRVLTKHGYKVLHAGSGAEALEICAQHDAGIDLLLTDVIMPHMSGRDLAEAVRRDRPNLKVLFMSGYPGDRVADKGVFNEGTGYVQKPFTADQLLEEVRTALDPIDSMSKGNGARPVKPVRSELPSAS